MFFVTLGMYTAEPSEELHAFEDSGSDMGVKCLLEFSVTEISTRD
jgi:hypothetical protein